MGGAAYVVLAVLVVGGVVFTITRRTRSRRATRAAAGPGGAGAQLMNGEVTLSG